MARNLDFHGWRGIRKIRTLPAMHTTMRRAGGMVAARATQLGIECVLDPAPSRNRARINVIPATAEDRLETAREPVKMLHAMDAGRHVF